MKLKHWMIAKTVVCLVFGLGMLFMPGVMFAPYGMSLGQAGIWVTRLLGQAFVLLAILLWLARNTAEPATRRAFALAVFVGDTIGLILSLLATLSGAQNALGWSNVVLYLILALGFGYFLLPGSAKK